LGKFAVEGDEFDAWSVFNFLLDKEHDALRWEYHIKGWWTAMFQSNGESLKLRVS
jgi:hypothetical protein